MEGCHHVTIPIPTALVNPIMEIPSGVGWGCVRACVRVCVRAWAGPSHLSFGSSLSHPSTFMGQHLQVPASQTSRAPAHMALELLLGSWG